MQDKFEHIIKNDLDLWNSSVDDESVTWAPSAATELDRVTGKPLDELTTCKNAQRFLRLTYDPLLIYRSCADGTKGYDTWYDGQQPFPAGRHFAAYRAHIG